MVVYIDELFFLNLLINYLLLLASAMLSGAPIRRGRMLLGAGVGAGYACLVFLPELQPIYTLLGKIAAAILMSLLAFGYENGRALLRRTLVFFLMSFLFAGLMMLLFQSGTGNHAVRNGVVYADISTGVLLAAAVGAYLLLTLLRGTPALQEKKPPQTTVQVTLFGKTLTLDAMLDTGNRLRDPLSNDRVLVVELRAVAEALPPGLRNLLTLFGVSDASAALRMLAASGYGAGFRLIPYSALGTHHGMLLALRPERMEQDGKTYQDILVALTDTALREETGCSAVLGA